MPETLCAICRQQVCEQCGGVVAQCRCMSCDKAVVVKVLCAKCAAQPQDKGSAGQQSASPCNTQFCGDHRK
jgi:hypothetical protein